MTIFARNLIILMLALNGGALHQSIAGPLLDAYLDTVGVATVGDLESQAADQKVITQKRNALPRVSADVRELWVQQNLEGVGRSGLQPNNQDYENTRLNIELDQPLIDPTIKPKVKVAKAQARQVRSRADLIAEYETRELIEQFLRGVRLQSLIRNTNHVISHLKRETNEVEKRKDANLATVSDVQNIRLALVSMKRDLNNFTLQRNYALLKMGTGTKTISVEQLDLDLSPYSIGWEIGGGEKTRQETPQLDGLRAEVDEFESRAKEVRRRSLPVVGLYAHYGLDNGGSPEFGGFRAGRENLSYYEAGFAVRWSLFDRGINRSEARELDLKREAKEAELRQKLKEQEQSASMNDELLEYSKTNERELQRLVEEYKVLKDASERAYEGGKGSYVDSIAAYLAYEATKRDLINAKHELLQNCIVNHAQATGWNEGLVEKVDSMILSSK